MDAAAALQYLQNLEDQEDDFDVLSDDSDNGDVYEGFIGEEVLHNIDTSGNFDSNIIAEDLINESRTNTDLLTSVMPSNESLVSMEADSMENLIFADLTNIARSRHLSGFSFIDGINRDSDGLAALKQLECEVAASQEDTYDDIPLAELFPAVTVPVQRPIRIQRRYPPYLKIYDIESAFNSNNYDYVQETDTEILTIKDPQGTVVESWTTERVSPSGRNLAVNCRSGTFGVYHPYKDIKSPSDIWQLFFTDSMIYDIVKWTNRAIHTVCMQNNLPINNSVYCVTDYFEIKAYIGFMYLRGCIGMNNKDVRLLYNVNSNENSLFPPIFHAVMSYNRFSFINAHIAFDDGTTRSERWKHDKFSAVRDMFQTFIKNCSKIYAPDEFLSLDETLYNTRVKVTFKVFMKNKPAKYGLLFRSLNSSIVPYTYTAIVSAGKPTTLPYKYHIDSTELYVKTLVRDLEQNMANTTGEIKGCNITMDRFFTSVPLARWLLSKNISCIGTIQHKRKGIKEMGCLEGREYWSTKFYKNVQDNRIHATSYVANTKSGIRNVILLDTYGKPIYGITSDKAKKPAIGKQYDFTKGGTDIVHQKMEYISVKPKSLRWTISAFSYILDTARVNSQTT